MKRKLIIVSLAMITAVTMTSGIAHAQQCAPPAGLFQLPLNQVPVPEPPNLFDFVKNKAAAVRLGKAFFWDMQVGSDGVTACATCHFSAGVDKRRKNTINPGMRAAVPDTTFQVKGPNESLIDSDFPFHLRDVPDFQASTVLRDSNDVVGSQGVHRHDFVGIAIGSAVDNGTPILDPIFNLDSNPTVTARNARRVTARNTPTNINAIFNFTNFWDGRAHFSFNGVNPFGPLDTTAGVWSNATGTLVKEKISIDLASLASQATGPPLDDVEMSWKGRTFPELGRKMLNLTPLGKQLVHPGDSVLGTLSSAVKQPNGKIIGSNGLSASYVQMIKDAFLDTWWNSAGTVSVDTVGGPQQFSQMEANFSLFWGLAIQLYEATLVADQTPFDRLLGGNTNALTTQECNGMNHFFGAALCSLCHAGTELTQASVAAGAFVTNIDHGLMEQMVVANGTDGIYDVGFNNTAVRPSSDDGARAGTSPFTNSLTGQLFPLGFSELGELQANGNMPFQTPFMPAQLPPNFPVTNKGSFKVPGLRNIDLTAPYFHNGDSLTLGQMVDFYTRGGNFPVANADALDVNIRELGAFQGGGGDVKMAEMVAFMKSLTDERVGNESAPFDHPEIFIPNLDPNVAAPDVLGKIPARDANGNISPPIALTINAVPAVTNKTSIQIGGSKESAATTVEASVNGGTPVPATATGDTTWSAAVDLAVGLNAITVTGTDTLGSVTLPASVTRTVSSGSFGGVGSAAGIADAVKALRIAVGLITPTAEDEINGDVAPLVNGVPAPDGRVGVDDALVILKKVVGLVSF